MDSLQKTIRERKGFAELEGDSMILKSTVLKELGLRVQKIREELDDAEKILFDVFNKGPINKVKIARLEARIQAKKEDLGLLVEQDGEK